MDAGVGGRVEAAAASFLSECVRASEGCFLDHAHNTIHSERPVGWIILLRKAAGVHKRRKGKVWRATREMIHTAKER